MRLLFFIMCSFSCTMQPESKEDVVTAREFTVYPPMSGLGTQLDVDIDASWSAFSYADTSFDFGEGINVIHSSVEDGWGDILSVYNLPTGKLLIKTEADGSVTTAFNSDES